MTTPSSSPAHTLTPLTYAQVYARVIDVLENTTRPEDPTDYYFNPKDEAPQCAIGYAFSGEIFPIRQQPSFVTADGKLTGCSVNSASISELINNGPLKDLTHDPLAVELLNDVQSQNDDKVDWKEIARWVRNNPAYSDPDVLPAQTDVALATGAAPGPA